MTLDRDDPKSIVDWLDETHNSHINDFLFQIIFRTSYFLPFQFLLSMHKLKFPIIDNNNKTQAKLKLYQTLHEGNYMEVINEHEHNCI
jgi:hypothetical protein